MAADLDDLERASILAARSGSETRALMAARALDALDVRSVMYVRILEGNPLSEGWTVTHELTIASF